MDNRCGSGHASLAAESEEAAQTFDARRGAAAADSAATTGQPDATGRAAPAGRHADTGIAVWMYGQQDKPEPTNRHAWDNFYCAYRTDNAVYLYVEKEKAYLLNDRMEAVWQFLTGILPKEKLHDCRKA